MRLWRLAAPAFAERLDGGYGLHHAGRWNRRGELVTYAATVPSLCVLEKLAHVEDLGLFPDGLRLVELLAPDDLPVTALERPGGLPDRWWQDIAVTQAIGSAWHRTGAAALLRVPSVLVRSREQADRNLVINHRHPRAAEIRIGSVEPFELDHRLLSRAAPAG